MTTVLTLQVKDSNGNVVGTAEITDNDVKTILDYILNNYADELYQKIIAELKNDEDTLTWLRGKLVAPVAPVVKAPQDLQRLYGFIMQLQLLNAMTNAVRPHDYLADTFASLVPVLVLVPLLKTLV